MPPTPRFCKNKKTKQKQVWAFLTPPPPPSSIQLALYNTSHALVLTFVRSLSAERSPVQLALMQQDKAGEKEPLSESGESAVNGLGLMRPSERAPHWRERDRGSAWELLSVCIAVACCRGCCGSGNVWEVHGCSLASVNCFSFSQTPRPTPPPSPISL